MVQPVFMAAGRPIAAVMYMAAAGLMFMAVAEAATAAAGQVFMEDGNQPAVAMPARSKASTHSVSQPLNHVIPLLLHKAAALLAAGAASAAAVQAAVVDVRAAADHNFNLIYSII